MRLRSLLALVGLVSAAACGSTEPTVATIEQTTFADSLHISLANFTRLASGMYVRDSIVGTGTAVAIGDTISTHYVGYFPSGGVFDKNLSGQTPFGVRVGAGRVIPGFEIGVQGMKVGGKRVMIIPPELAYGSAGAGSIPGYAVILFTVDVTGKP
jgi:FKBP-type peptidyl-prolyl cis-trans isomerase